MNYKNMLISILFLCASSNILLAMDLDENSSLIMDRTKITDLKIQELLIASANGDIDKVIKSIMGGVSVNATDEYGATALHYAVGNWYGKANKRLKTIKYLFRVGADAKAVDQRGLTPLHYVLSNGGCHDLEVMKFLIKCGADPNTTDANTSFSCSNWTPLFHAVRKNDIESAQFFLQNGANVDAKDCCENTPLHYAVLHSTPEMIKLLVTAGADINVRDGVGQTPLYDACRDNKYQNAEVLLELGADVNIRDRIFWPDSKKVKTIGVAYPEGVEKPEIPYFDVCAQGCASGGLGNSALHIACDKGNDQLVDLLIKNRADVNSITRFGTTPLHMAAYKGHTSIVEKLFTARANANIGTIETMLILPEGYEVNGGVTPLFSAITSNCLDIVKLIVPKTDINRAAGAIGATSLHYACQIGNFDIVKELIKNKANPRALFRNHFSAIEIALSNKNIEIAQYLTVLTQKLPKEIKDDVDFQFIPHNTCCKKSSIFLYKHPKNGTYCNYSDNLIPALFCTDNLRSSVAKNHLITAGYSVHVQEKEKLEKDIYHNFPRLVEKEYGHWIHTKITDFEPKKSKVYWKKQLNTKDIEDYCFELHCELRARVHEGDYPSKKAQQKGPSGTIEYVVLAKGLDENAEKMIVHRKFKCNSNK